MMQVFKRKLWQMVKGLILAPFGAVLVYIIGGFFTENMTLLGAVAAAVFLLLVYMAIFSENIRFELEDSGTLRYYKKGSLKHEFDLSNCAAGYRRKSERGLLGSHDITLEIADLSTGQEFFLDCSPLGLGGFERMFAGIESHTPKQEENILRAKPAQ